jgi:hypothetical protein
MPAFTMTGELCQRLLRQDYSKYSKIYYKKEITPGGKDIKVGNIHINLNVILVF